MSHEENLNYIYMVNKFKPKDSNDVSNGNSSNGKGMGKIMSNIHMDVDKKNIITNDQDIRIRSQDLIIESGDVIIKSGDIILKSGKIIREQ